MVLLIRNKINLILEENDLTIAEACRRTGLARSIMSRLVNNQVTNMNLDTLSALCTGLQVTVPDILEFVHEDDMGREDIVHQTEREMYVKEYTKMRKRSARKAKKEGEDE